MREELAHLRKECRSQARKLDDMQHLVTEREDEGDALKSKVSKILLSLGRIGMHSTQKQASVHLHSQKDARKMLQEQMVSGGTMGERGKQDAFSPPAHRRRPKPLKFQAFPKNIKGQPQSPTPPTPQRLFQRVVGESMSIFVQQNTRVSTR